MKMQFNKTFLVKLFREDRPFAIGLFIILGIYFCVHLFKLEVFPLYMFAMYSEPIHPQEEYMSFRIYEDDRPVDMKSLNYRYFTYLNNTIYQYNGILSNNGYHTESNVIDKFGQRLHLSSSFVEEFKSPFLYDLKKLDIQMNDWFLRERKASLMIEKATFNWKYSTPSLKRKEIIYEVD